MTIMIATEELLAAILPRLEGGRSGRDLASWAGRKDTSRKTAAEIPRRSSGGSREGEPGMALWDGSVGSGNAGCLQHQDPTSE